MLGSINSPHHTKVYIMGKYHALILFTKEKMLELSPAKLMLILQEAEELDATKITIDFKENHKSGKYPTGPVYTIPHFDAINDMQRIYKWVYGAYLNGDAYCRIVFGDVPCDGQPFINLSTKYRKR